MPHASLVVNNLYMHTNVHISTFSMTYCKVSLSSKVAKSTASNTLSSLFLNDNDDDDDGFDLDSYDPYGLDKLAKSRPPPS
jgi:hypothetical protein